MSTHWLQKTMIAVLVLPVFACSLFTSSPAPDAADIEKEEQAVYSFFVNGNPTLILQETATDMSSDDPKQILKYIKSNLSGLKRDTANSFIERNQQPSQLSSDMQLGVDYVLLSTEELSKITSQPNWHEVLNEKYPGSQGYTIFSRVGFNNTLDQAVIYVGNVRGPLMGSGSYYLMQKQDGEWRIKEQVMVWIS
jgi:hypothetical protein